MNKSNVVAIETAGCQAAVDELGRLKAAQAEAKKAYEEQLEIVKSYAKRLKTNELDGCLFHCVISDATRETLDMEAVRAKLSPQFIAAHTNVTAYQTVRVYARKS